MKNVCLHVYAYTYVSSSLRIWNHRLDHKVFQTQLPRFSLKRYFSIHKHFITLPPPLSILFCWSADRRNLRRKGNGSNLPWWNCVTPTDPSSSHLCLQWVHGKPCPMTLPTPTSLLVHQLALLVLPSLGEIGWGRINLAKRLPLPYDHVGLKVRACSRASSFSVHSPYGEPRSFSVFICSTSFPSALLFSPSSRLR